MTLLFSAGLLFNYDFSAITGLMDPRKDERDSNGFHVMVEDEVRKTYYSIFLHAAWLGWLLYLVSRRFILAVVMAAHLLSPFRPKRCRRQTSKCSTVRMVVRLRCRMPTRLLTA